MQVPPLFSLTFFVLAVSLILGGGTTEGLLSGVVIESVSVPLLLLALWRWIETPKPDRPAWAMAFCLAFLTLVAAQLAPLPPSFWSHLPNRDSIVESFRLIDRPLPWAQISVEAQSTRDSALAFVAPMALFFGAWALRPSQRRMLLLAILPFGALNVLFGLLQVAQGPTGWARFYQITNLDEAVGLFANRNHLAALLYCSILIAAAWLSDNASQGVSRKKLNKGDASTLVAILGGVTMIAVLFLGVILTRSRMGLLLSLSALGGAYLLNRRDSRSKTTNLSSSKLLVGSLVLGLGLALQFGVYRILERFASDPTGDFRWVITKRGLAAAMAYFPIGSGFGTFVPVYANIERPQDALQDIYVNHAHNDYLETLIDGGVLGAALVAVFIAWWARGTRRLWRGHRTHVPGLDIHMARAGSIAVALLLIHSAFDYPLRTGAMAAVFALSCAVMLPSPEPDPDEEAPYSRMHAEKASDGGGKKHRRRKEPAVEPASRPKTARMAPTPKDDKSILDEIEWPDEWKK